MLGLRKSLPWSRWIAFCQVLAFVRDLEAFEVELELRVWDRIADPGP